VGVVLRPTDGCGQGRFIPGKAFALLVPSAAAAAAAVAVAAAATVKHGTLSSQGSVVDSVVAETNVESVKRGNIYHRPKIEQVQTRSLYGFMLGFAIVT
jgi:hypothetical protein